MLETSNFPKLQGTQIPQNLPVVQQRSQVEVVGMLQEDSHPVADCSRLGDSLAVVERSHLDSLAGAGDSPQQQDRRRLLVLAARRMLVVAAPRWRAHVFRAPARSR